MASTREPIASRAQGLTAWRLDREKYAAQWNSGEGAYRAGGRWNSVGMRAVYCSLDAATAILEVAVHVGFEVLATVPHIMTQIRVMDISDVHIASESDIPHQDWLAPDIQTPEQQTFGDALLKQYRFVQIPSVVSRDSWNLIFEPTAATGRYTMVSQKPFRLDPRLGP